MFILCTFCPQKNVAAAIDTGWCVWEGRRCLHTFHFITGEALLPCVSNAGEMGAAVVGAGGLDLGLFVGSSLAKCAPGGVIGGVGDSSDRDASSAVVAEKGGVYIFVK